MNETTDFECKGFFEDLVAEIHSVYGGSKEQAMKVVGKIRWAYAGSSVYVTADDNSEHRLYRIRHKYQQMMLRLSREEGISVGRFRQLLRGRYPDPDHSQASML